MSTNIGCSGSSHGSGNLARGGNSRPPRSSTPISGGSGELPQPSYSGRACPRHGRPVGPPPRKPSPEVVDLSSDDEGEFGCSRDILEMFVADCEKHLDQRTQFSFTYPGARARFVRDVNVLRVYQELEELKRQRQRNPYYQAVKPTYKYTAEDLADANDLWPSH